MLLRPCSYMNFSICYSEVVNQFSRSKLLPFIYLLRSTKLKMSFVNVLLSRSKRPLFIFLLRSTNHKTKLIFEKLAGGSTRPCANASVTVKLTVSWYISLLHKHVYSHALTRVNASAHVCFYKNRCVFARGVCSRVSVKTHAKTHKNTASTPSLTVSWLILSSLTMCQITLTNASTLVLSRLSKQMPSCQLTRRRMHRHKQFCYSGWLVFWNGCMLITLWSRVKSRL